MRRPGSLPEAPPLPDADAGKPEEIWPQYFRKYRPTPQAVSRHVEKLHRQGEHEHVIALIQSAILNSQSQPWMYEVLALSMEIQGRDPKEVSRVVLSLTDFGAVDFGSMLYSAAYLVRLDRKQAALHLYQQASRLNPERPEPYILGLGLARKLKDVDGIIWSADGILRYAWTRDYRKLHRKAENAALEAERQLRKSGDHARAERIKKTISQARQRDLVIRLTWSGEGDLDLSVEEPGDQICSYQNPETLSGGILLHDGFGPDAKNTYEEYICPFAYSGIYRLRISHAWGKIVGRRATLTIIRHHGSPRESVETRTMTIGADDVLVRMQLDQGRRKANRLVTSRTIQSDLAASQIARKPRSNKLRTGKVLKDFATSREEASSRTIQRAGAIGFRPVIRIIPDGATLQAQAIVSPDRRYVRIGIAPTFSNITDVFTFTTVTGLSIGNLQPGVLGN